MYRIIHAEHHRTGDKWCIYPMYDYAHGRDESIERITHSISAPWKFDAPSAVRLLIQALLLFSSHQYEFARLNLTYTMMSAQAAEARAGGRRDGLGRSPCRRSALCAAAGIHARLNCTFAEMVGVAKRDNVIDLGKLEYCVREDLNRVAQRRMAVLNPLKVVITNYEDDKTELFTAINNPEDETAGTRQVPFSKVIWIERDDFMENPPKKFFRLAGRRGAPAPFVPHQCEEAADDEGATSPTGVFCTTDPMSGGGSSSDGRR